MLLQDVAFINPASLLKLCSAFAGVQSRTEQLERCGKEFHKNDKFERALAQTLICRLRQPPCAGLERGLSLARSLDGASA